MSDDPSTNPSSLDQGIDASIKPAMVQPEKYVKEEKKLVAKELSPPSDAAPKDTKSWTMAEIERVVSSEIVRNPSQRLGQFGIGLTRKNDFRLKDLARRVENQTTRDFSDEITKGPVNRRLRQYDVKSYTMRMITANATLGTYQFQKTQQLPFMRKSLALDYEKTNLLKKIAAGIGSLERALVSKLEAIKLNTAAVVPTKESRLAKIRKAITDKINDRIATNFANYTLAGYDEKYKKYISPTLSRIHGKLSQKGRGGGVNGAMGVVTRKLNDLRHSVAKAGREGDKNPSVFNKFTSGILSSAVKVTQRARLPEGISGLIAKPLAYATDSLAKVQPFEKTSEVKALTAIDKDLHHTPPPSLVGSDNNGLLRFLKKSKKEEDVYRKTLLTHVKAIRYHLVPNKHNIAQRQTLPTVAKPSRITSLFYHKKMTGSTPGSLPKAQIGKLHPFVHTPTPHHEDIRHPKPSVLTSLFGKLYTKISSMDMSLVKDRKAKALFDKAQTKKQAVLDKLAQRAKVRKNSYEDLEEQRQKRRGFLPWGALGAGAAGAEGMPGKPDDPDNHPVDKTGIPSIGAMGLTALGFAGRNLLKYGWKGTKFAGKYGWKFGKKALPFAGKTGLKGAGVLGRFGLREAKGIGKVGAKGLSAAGGRSAGLLARILGSSVKGIPLLSLGAEGIDYLDGEKAVNWRNLLKSGIALGGGALGGLGGGLLTAGMGGEFVGGVAGYAGGRKLADTLLGDDSVTNKPDPQNPKGKNDPSFLERLRQATAWKPAWIKKKGLLPRLRDALSTGSTDPRQPSRATRFGKALRYGLTTKGIKDYSRKLLGEQAVVDDKGHIQHKEVTSIMDDIHTAFFGRKAKVTKTGELIVSDKRSLMGDLSLKLDRAIFGDKVVDKNGNVRNGTAVVAQLNKTFGATFAGIVDRMLGLSPQKLDPASPKNPLSSQPGSNKGYPTTSGSPSGGFLGSIFGGNFGSAQQPASRNQAKIVKGGVKDQPQFKDAYTKLPPPLKKVVDGSKTLQFVLWSTSIQHGADAAALIFQRDYSDKLDEKSYIRSIYQDRSTKFSNLSSMDRSQAIQHLGDEQKFVEGMRTGTNTPDMATMGRQVNNVINPSGNASLSYDPSSVKAAPISGNVASRAKDAMAYLMSKQYTKNAAAGIVGNLIEESALMTNRPGDGGRAFGLAQWHPDRRNPIAKKFGKPVEAMNFHEQLDAVDWEIRTGSGVTGGKNLFADLNATKDPGEAARMVMNRYERPAERQHNGMVRSANAMGVVKNMGDAPASPPAPAAAAPAKTAGTAAPAKPKPKQAASKTSPTDKYFTSHPAMEQHSQSMDAFAAVMQRHTEALNGSNMTMPGSGKPGGNTTVISPFLAPPSTGDHFVMMSMKKNAVAIGDN